MEAHFREHLQEAAEKVLTRCAEQVANPFTFFDGIFCLNVEAEAARWENIQGRFQTLGIEWRVERFQAVVTPDNHHRGCALSFRGMIAEARRRGYANVLIFEDDAVFLDTTLDVVRQVVADVPPEWDLLYLGACVHSARFPFIDGNTVLQQSGGVTCTHAIAVNQSAYDRFLDDVPGGDEPAFEEWMRRYGAVDPYFSAQVIAGAYKSLIAWPRVATQPVLATFADADLEWRDRYTI